MFSDTNELRSKLLDLISIIDEVCQKNGIWYSLACGSVLGAVRHRGFIPWDSDMDIYVAFPQLGEFRKAIKDSISDDLHYYEWEKEYDYHPVFDRLSYSEIDSQQLHIDIFPLIGAPDDDKKRRKYIRKCFLSYRLFRCKHVDPEFSKDTHKKYVKLIGSAMKLVPEKMIKAIELRIETEYDLNESDYCYYYSSGYAEKGCMPKELVLNSKRTEFENLMLPIPQNYDDYLTRLYGDYMVEKKSGYKVIDKYI